MGLSGIWEARLPNLGSHTSQHRGEGLKQRTRGVGQAGEENETEDRLSMALTRTCAAGADGASPRRGTGGRTPVGVVCLGVVEVAWLLGVSRTTVRVLVMPRCVGNCRFDVCTGVRPVGGNKKG